MLLIEFKDSSVLILFSDILFLFFFLSYNHLQVMAADFNILHASIYIMSMLMKMGKSNEVQKSRRNHKG